MTRERRIRRTREELEPWAAIIIGAAAGLCHSAVYLKDIFHYDDSLDVVGVPTAPSGCG